MDRYSLEQMWAKFKHLGNQVACALVVLCMSIILLGRMSLVQSVFGPLAADDAKGLSLLLNGDCPITVGMGLRVNIGLPFVGCCSLHTWQKVHVLRLARLWSILLKSEGRPGLKHQKLELGMAVDKS